MNIAIHDSEKESSNSRIKFPNLALMKISAYHKMLGDTVEWFENNEKRKVEYDKVYSSKVFSFSPENPYLPPDTIKGGTGYDYSVKLAKIVEDMYLDYSIYPLCNYAIGFLTRGCVRNCEWCITPKKEGKIAPYRGVFDIARRDTKKIILMDNNVLSCDYGIWQLVKIADSPFQVDFNQGLDCRFVTPQIAEIITNIKWIKNIRFACDNIQTVEPLIKAVKMLEKFGVTQTKIRVYFLVKDIGEAMARVKILRQYTPRIRLYGQAYRDFENGGIPFSKEALDFAQRYIYRQSWQKRDWYDTPLGKTYFQQKGSENKNGI